MATVFAPAKMGGVIAVPEWACTCYGQSRKCASVQLLTAITCETPQTRWCHLHPCRLSHRCHSFRPSRFWCSLCDRRSLRRRKTYINRGVRPMPDFHSHCNRTHEDKMQVTLCQLFPARARCSGKYRASHFWLQSPCT